MRHAHARRASAPVPSPEQAQGSNDNGERFKVTTTSTTSVNLTAVHAQLRSAIDEDLRLIADGDERESGPALKRVRFLKRATKAVQSAINASTKKAVKAKPAAKGSKD